jgi:hypothetical protein
MTDPATNRVAAPNRQGVSASSAEGCNASTVTALN